MPIHRRGNSSTGSNLTRRTAIACIRSFPEQPPAVAPRSDRTPGFCESAVRLPRPVTNLADGWAEHSQPSAGIVTELCWRRRHHPAILSVQNLYILSFVASYEAAFSELCVPSLCLCPATGTGGSCIPERYGYGCQRRRGAGRQSRDSVGRDGVSTPNHYRDGWDLPDSGTADQHVHRHVFQGRLQAHRGERGGAGGRTAADH